MYQCDTEAECDGNHVCSESYQCQRKACTNDANCGDYCVQGRCFDTLGTCQEPAA